MAVYQSIGLTSSWLHLLPLLAILAVIAFQLWIDAMRGPKISSARLMKLWEITKNALLEPKQSPLNANAASNWTGIREWIKSPYGPFLITVLLIAAMFAYSRFLPYHWPVTVERNVAVVDIIGAYRYTFQAVDDAGNLYGQEFTEDICRDYESPKGDFLKGVILRELIHDVEDGCWSLNPDKHCGYFKKRDANKNPLYARLTE